VRIAGLSCTAVSKPTLCALGARGVLSICVVFVFTHRTLLAVLGGCVRKEASIAVGGEGAASIRICNEGQKSEAISALMARKFKMYELYLGCLR
jgi:hypothetical protein